MITKRNSSTKPELDLARTGSPLGSKARKRGRAGSLYAGTSKPGQTGPDAIAKGVVVNPPRPRSLAAKKTSQPAKGVVLERPRPLAVKEAHKPTQSAVVIANKPTAAANARKSAR